MLTKDALAAIAENPMLIHTMDAREIVAHITELEADRARLISAASCIHHWHDTNDGGMIVSGEKVRALWDVLAAMREVS